MSTKTRKRANLFTRTVAEVLETELGEGVCGRIRAAVLTYSVIDTWGTVWKPGCMDKTRAKVGAGKVDFFVANEDSYHQYGTRTHIGIVRALETVGEQEIAVIDLFDTEEGRTYKDYVKKVMAAGGNTGYSVGVYDRSPTPTFIKSATGQDIYVFTEVELDEITGTARPAVPGTRPLAVRSEGGSETTDDVKWQVFDTLVRSLPADQVRARLEAAGALHPAAPQGDATAHEDPPADKAAGDSDAQASRSAPATSEAPEYATMEARIAVLRAFIAA